MSLRTALKAPMSSQEGPAKITGDAELDFALHVYMSSEAYKVYDAVRTPQARQILLKTDAHDAYRRVVEAYVLRGGLPRRRKHE